jgi:hypothetical protein
VADTVRAARWHLEILGAPSEPYHDAEVLELIRHGLKSIRIRPEAADDDFPWVPLDSHPPFAAAVAARGATPSHSSTAQRKTRPPLGWVAACALLTGICVALYLQAATPKPQEVAPSQRASGSMQLGMAELRDTVQAVDMGIVPEPLGIDGSWLLSGRIRNRSRYIELAEVVFSVTATDCIESAPEHDDHSACETIAQVDVNVPLQVPPGQSRNFSKSFLSGDVRAHGQLRWRYSVLRASAPVR